MRPTQFFFKKYGQFLKILRLVRPKWSNTPNKYKLESVFKYYLTFIIEKPLHLSDIFEEDVFKITQSIDILKAPGTDNLSGKFLIERAEILAEPISEICKSVISKTHPNACKVPNLKPIFRKSKNTNPCNYRPISLLPLVSKILERVIHDQKNALLKTKKSF